MQLRCPPFLTYKLRQTTAHVSSGLLSEATRPPLLFVAAMLHQDIISCGEISEAIGGRANRSFWPEKMQIQDRNGTEDETNRRLISLVACMVLVVRDVMI
jgi:hypothetical protein